MPPKKQQEKKKSDSVKVDKTFGMKNKKGAATQRAMAQIKQQQAMAGKTKEDLAKEKRKEEEKKLKAAAEKARKEEAALFTIIQPKVPFGVDPKTVVCEFWKHGRCDKSALKCKYAHSHDAGRKVEKKDLYTDTRDADGNVVGSSGDAKKGGTMEGWDQAKLDSVILSKHGNPKTTTDKVCKFFLQAVEESKYGWFWECPNGQNCMYRHALPPGFVLKAQKKALAEAEKENEITLEDFLEVERHKLGKDLTPVTPESFAAWKQNRLDRKAAQEEAERNKKAMQAAANKMAGLSGREMFELNADFFAGEEDDEDDDDEFDMAEYMKNYNRDQRSEDGDEHGGRANSDDEEDDHETIDGHGSSAGDKVNGKMAELSVNGDEGEEEGRRK
ncbi:Translation machinery-associated protein 46 [Tilletia horrida]|uniref:Translation machinery-associated protein 46 n=1 Tax=Tilletia horrida TaxID=155126 RepID=A0AAN6GL31_9BASI|nr:Translation machinery-associated protein 46 [Tilletia horrida]KAK0551033.1 Translation machinery-associated protein 46 [Tilletia horrida]KAK0570149.1 Translation machinery-associated protein 46 [Tilletia horrida]